MTAFHLALLVVLLTGAPVTIAVAIALILSDRDPP